MVFSHINQGSMDLGASTTAAFTLFETMDADVTYLGRDFLKCCGHDQKWQGMTEVFEKLKAYNQKRIEPVASTHSFPPVLSASGPSLEITSSRASR